MVPERTSQWHSLLLTISTHLYHRGSLPPQKMVLPGAAGQQFFVAVFVVAVCRRPLGESSDLAQVCFVTHYNLLLMRAYNM